MTTTIHFKQNGVYRKGIVQGFMTHAQAVKSFTQQAIPYSGALMLTYQR